MVLDNLNFIQPAIILERNERMQTQTRKTPFLLVAALLAALLLTSLACSLGTLTVGQRSATLDVHLNQDQVNQFFETVEVDNRPGHYNLLDKITRVEMHDGFIRVFGTETTSDGSVVSGYFDASLAAEDDLLKVQIIGVDIPGVQLSDPRIVEANQTLARELSRAAMAPDGEVQFKEASVSEGSLNMKVQVNYRNYSD